LKTLTTIALLCTTLLAGTVHAHNAHDISYISRNDTLIIIPKPAQSTASACADAPRTGVAASIVKIRLIVKEKIVYVTCK
jgi:tRNA/tmRNA/rRNA uracil-C5-methylase (TrmA/RlmC/RlmD family)